MDIDLNKPYLTRSGHRTALLMTVGGGEFPIIGAYEQDGIWRPFAWRKDGTASGLGAGAFMDLVEKTIERDLWINLYPNGAAGGAYATEELAKAQAGTNIEARVKVKVTYKKGDGL